jgi:hypothetical protein
MKTIFLLLGITFSLSFQEHRVDFEGSYEADYCGYLELIFKEEGNYALKYSHFELSGTYHSKGIFVKNHDTLILNEVSHKIVADTFRRTKDGIVVSEFTMPIIFDTTNYGEELRQLLLIVKNDTLLKTESIYCGGVHARQKEFWTYFKKSSVSLEIPEGQLKD